MLCHEFSCLLFGELSFRQTNFASPNITWNSVISFGLSYSLLLHRVRNWKKKADIKCQNLTASKLEVRGKKCSSLCKICCIKDKELCSQLHLPFFSNCGSFEHSMYFYLKILFTWPLDLNIQLWSFFRCCYFCWSFHSLFKYVCLCLCITICIFSRLLFNNLSLWIEFAFVFYLHGLIQVRYNLAETAGWLVMQTGQNKLVFPYVPLKSCECWTMYII